jgi:hypothetical protein
MLTGAGIAVPLKDAYWAEILLCQTERRFRWRRTGRSVARLRASVSSTAVANRLRARGVAGTRYVIYEGERIDDTWLDLAGGTDTAAIQT